MLTYVISNRQQDVLASKRFVNNEHKAKLDMLQSVVEAEDILKGEFAVTQIVTNAPTWMLANAKGIHLGEERAYLQPFYGDDVMDNESTEAFADSVAPFPIKNVFVEPKAFVEGAKELLSNVTFRHTLSQLVRQTYRIQKQFDQIMILQVCLFENEVGLVLMINGSLKFTKLIPSSNTSEVMQVIEDLHEALGLEVSKLRIILTGRASYKQAVCDAIIKRYRRIMEVNDYFPPDDDLKSAGYGLDEFSELIIKN